MNAQELFDVLQTTEKIVSLEKITICRNSTSELQKIMLNADKLLLVFDDSTFGDVDSVIKITGITSQEMRQSVIDAFMNIKADLMKQIKEQDE